MVWCSVLIEEVKIKSFMVSGLSRSLSWLQETALHLMVGCTKNSMHVHIYSTHMFIHHKTHSKK